MPALSIFEFTLRLILGAFFVVTGLLKLPEPIPFLNSIRNFHLIGDPWAGLLAMGLPWLEIFCGLGVIFRKLYAGSLVITAGSLLVFTGVLVWAWSQGLDVDCGCFGKTDFGISDVQHILLNLIFFGISAWLFWRFTHTSAKPAHP